jgi:hypothetical protein
MYVKIASKRQHCEVADALCCSQQTVGARGKAAACRTQDIEQNRIDKL